MVHSRSVFAWPFYPKFSQPITPLLTHETETDSKVHGANMGPIWGQQDPGGPHAGPMNFDIWVSMSSLKFDKISKFVPQYFTISHHTELCFNGIQHYMCIHSHLFSTHITRSGFLLVVHPCVWYQLGSFNWCLLNSKSLSTLLQPYTLMFAVYWSMFSSFHGMDCTQERLISLLMK